MGQQLLMPFSPSVPKLRHPEEILRINFSPFTSSSTPPPGVSATTGATQEVDASCTEPLLDVSQTTLRSAEVGMLRVDDLSHSLVDWGNGGSNLVSKLQGSLLRGGKTDTAAFIGSTL